MAFTLPIDILTPDGRSRLDAEQSSWRTMATAIDRVLGAPTPRVSPLGEATP